MIIFIQRQLFTKYLPLFLLVYFGGITPFCLAEMVIRILKMVNLIFVRLGIKMRLFPVRLSILEIILVNFKVLMVITASVSNLNRVGIPILTTLIISLFGFMLYRIVKSKRKTPSSLSFLITIFTMIKDTKFGLPKRLVTVNGLN